MSVHRFELRSDCVEPRTLPKLLALAPSGGSAKTMIAACLVP